MRYEGTAPSRSDPQVDVYRFAMGIEELKALLSVVEHYVKGIPDHLETQQLKQRLSEIRKGLREAKLYNRLSKRNLGNGNSEAEKGD